jgi:hypothetical protein
MAHDWRKDPITDPYFDIPGAGNIVTQPKNVTDSIPHDFKYDFEEGLWLCLRCKYSTASKQIYHYGCAPVARQKALI